MIFEHVALDDDTLGPSVKKLVDPSAPPPLRAMAAKGLAPLAPRDLIVALYQLWVTNIDQLAEQCVQTLSGLPDPVLQGAVGDASLPAGVVDWLAWKLIKKSSFVDQVIRHPQVADATLVRVAGAGGDRLCDTLAENQIRWRACPAIVVALYGNRHCRQSVIHRVLETAVRSNIEVDLPMMDEIRQALGAETPNPERDQDFAQALAGLPSESENLGALEGANGPVKAEGEDEKPPANANLTYAAEVLDEAGDDEAVAQRAVEMLSQGENPDVKRARHAELRGMSPMGKIRAALLGTATDRAVLVRDTNKTVAMAAIKCPRVTDAEVVVYAADRSLSNDVIRFIAQKREWLKLYAVKFNLVMNPKTPMSRSLSLLVFLHRRDIQKVSRSKNVPSALAKAAKRKLAEAA